MPKMFIVVVASAVLLLVAAPAGALVIFSGVIGEYNSHTPETYLSGEIRSGFADPWDWSLMPFSNPPPAIDHGPITARIFEEGTEFTPYGSNDPFDWNPGRLNTVAKSGRMGQGTPSQDVDRAPAYASGDPNAGS